MPDVLIAPPPEERFIEVIRSRVVEGCDISVLGARAITAPLWCLLTAGSPSQTATWNVPNGYKFRFQAIRAHVAFLDPASETMVDGGQLVSAGAGLILGRGTVFDRIMAKAMNCRITLTIANARGGDIIAQKSFPLSDLLTYTGDPATFFDCPMPVGIESIFNLTASLTDVAAAGSSTEYGVELDGALILSR